MALPGITCPEKIIIPLYFQASEQGELSKLFQKDSIFEHLFDPWKPEAVKAISYEDCSLLKYMHSHFLSLKSPIFASLKQFKDKFNDLIKQLLPTNDTYSIILQENFMKNLNALDNDIMITILKYYSILEEHKRLSQVKYDHIKSAISLKQKIEKLSTKISKLSYSLQYETCGGIKISKLEINNSQFSRCDKAICDNIKSQFFKDSSFSSIKLCTAFKIDHFHLLKSFEKKIKVSENSVLKGLFFSIKKKQIASLSVFGVEKIQFVKNQGYAHYLNNYCRLPNSLIGKTKIEEILNNSEGFLNEIHASSNSTLIKDEKKLGSNSNCVLILVLCRAILPRSKQDAGFNPETQEFTISDFTSVYPEYILICTKEKSSFEIFPEKHFIIPVKLTDINSSNSNKMSIENFYSCINKAFDSSQLQRNKLKNELIGQIDGFWSGKNSKQVLVNTILETKRRFIEKIKGENENLRKELLGLQRQTESLKQIKNIRCRSA